MEYKTIGGILLAIIVTSIGTSYIVEDEGFKNCPGGWELNNHTGRFDCSSRNISEFCFKLSSSGYRCYLGKKVQLQKKNVTLEANGCEYVCYPEGRMDRNTVCECNGMKNTLGRIL